MKYIIQVFRSNGNCGVWENTAWAGNEEDLDVLKNRLKEIASNFRVDDKVTKVRLMEVIQEIEIKREC